MDAGDALLQEGVIGPSPWSRLFPLSTVHWGRGYLVEGLIQAARLDFNVDSISPAFLLSMLLSIPYNPKIVRLANFPC